jgi:hypothetical protein
MYLEEAPSLHPYSSDDLDGEVGSEEEKSHFANDHKQREASDVRQEAENVDSDV